VLFAVDKEAAKAKPDHPKASNTFECQFYKHRSGLYVHSIALDILCIRLQFAKHVDVLSRGDRGGVQFALKTIDGVRGRIRGVTNRIPVQPPLPGIDGDADECGGDR
jgi:hypothetical protein